MNSTASNKNERGTALVEFTIGALVFMIATFSVIEVARMLWTHNALTDATRRAARYAVINASEDEEAVKNVAVYGNAEGTGSKLVNDLDTTQIDVSYETSSITGVFGYPDGKVTVQITGYEFNLVIPIAGVTVTMPDYRTTLTAESAGQPVDDITTGPTPNPTPTPLPTPGPTPNPTPNPTPAPTPQPTPTPAPTPAPSPTPRPTPTPCPCGKKPSGVCKKC